MPTEDQLRDLLDRAGRTIDVTPGPPVEKERRGQWRAPLAAAAVVAVIAGGVGFVVSRGGDGSSAPAGQGTSTPSSDASPTVAPTTDPPVVPSLLGMTQAEARTELADLGLGEHVELVEKTCYPRNVVLGTDPAPGVPVDAGATVTVEISQWTTVVTDCTGEPDYEAPWAVIRAAQGLDARMKAADQVTIIDAGATVATLSRSEAIDPDNWGSVGDALRGLLAGEEGAGPLTVDAIVNRECPLTLPVATEGRTYSIGVDTGQCPAMTVDVTEDWDGTVVAVEVRRAVDQMPTIVVPDVVGLQDFEAYAALRAAHLVSDQRDVVAEEPCPEIFSIVAQSPAAGTVVEPYSTVRIDWVVNEPPCGT